MNDSRNDDQMLPSPQGSVSHTVGHSSARTDSTGTGSHGSGAGASQSYSPQASDVPMNAGDIDLIEKEWVMKAKAIVASTVGNPRQQSMELSKAKAQYIAKRFNKELPGNDKT